MCDCLTLNGLFPLLLQALPNQQTVDYPSFKLVIVGDGGTGVFNFSAVLFFIFYFKINVVDCHFGLRDGAGFSIENNDIVLPW